MHSIKLCVPAALKVQLVKMSSRIVWFACSPGHKEADQSGSLQGDQWRPKVHQGGAFVGRCDGAIDAEALHGLGQGERPLEGHAAHGINTKLCQTTVTVSSVVEHLLHHGTAVRATE
jgi:hypothetical protein